MWNIKYVWGWEVLADGEGRRRRYGTNGKTHKVAKRGKFQHVSFRSCYTWRESWGSKKKSKYVFSCWMDVGWSSVCVLKSHHNSDILATLIRCVCLLFEMMFVTLNGFFLELPFLFISLIRFWRTRKYFEIFSKSFCSRELLLFYKWWIKTNKLHTKRDRGGGQNGVVWRTRKLFL